MSYCFNPGCPEPQNQEGTDRCVGCGARLWLGDRYAAVRVLGRGRLGRTFLAIDRTEMRPCVVKQCWEKVLPLGDRQRAMALFQQERDRLESLGKHPQIPAWLDSVEQDGYLYWVQEYIAGETLATRLATHGAFNSAEIWHLLETLLPVLQFIHSHQIIHRDIKPENIILQTCSDSIEHSELIVDRTPILVDFGAAKLATALMLAQSGTAIGSPEYAAPEQLKGHACFASDLYSLGVTCIHLLTDVHPFQLFDFANHQWDWRTYWLADADSGTAADRDRLATILDRLIAPALSQRFHSATAAIAAIHPLRGKKIATPTPAPVPNWHCSATLTGHQGLFAGVNAVALNSNQQQLASASDDKTIRVWDLASITQQKILNGHAQFVKSVIFHPANELILASGSRDRTIKLWNWQQQDVIKTLVGHTQSVNSIAFSPDGTMLASGSSDKTIKLWQWQTDEPPVTLSAAILAVNAIAFSPVAPLLASASSDSTVQIWHLKDFSRVQTLSAHTKAVSAIAFSPDGTLLATGGEDCSIRLWDVASWQCIRILSGHPWSVSALAFSTDGTRLISASWDKTVKIWQISTGQAVGVCLGHQDSVTSLAIAASGTFIASGSRDRTLKLWNQP